MVVAVCLSFRSEAEESASVFAIALSFVVGHAFVCHPRCCHPFFVCHSAAKRRNLLLALLFPFLLPLATLLFVIRVVVPSLFVIPQRSGGICCLPYRHHFQAVTDISPNNPSKITCQAPKPPNSLSANDMRLAHLPWFNPYN
jgi:hypothetical protein